MHIFIFTSKLDNDWSLVETSHTFTVTFTYIQRKTEIQGQMVQKFPWKAPRKSVTNLIHEHTNHSTNNFGTSVGKIKTYFQNLSSFVKILKNCVVFHDINLTQFKLEFSI